MILSESMVEILRLLNEFGFCDIRHIEKRFNVGKSVAYNNLKCLIQYGLITNARVIQYHPRAYYLTAKGINLLKLDLPIIRGIPLNIFEHQLAVIDVFIKLRMMHPEAAWVSERRLAREVKKHDHLPDGVLIFPQGHQCAIEVEKSMKSRDRLKDILIGYGLQKTYKEVWYFCSKNIMPAISELTSNMPYIKIHTLSEYSI